jgi:post-segregation antitoxin (ccd killing protein)
MEKDKTLIQSFYNFLEDSEGLTDEDMVAELKEQGIDVSALKMRVAEVVKRGSEKRRLAWRERARKKRSEIEKLLEGKEATSGMTDLKRKISDILTGSYGQGALSYAETYFRKKDALTEKDLLSLIEDLEDLNLLDNSSKKG